MKKLEITWLTAPETGPPYLGTARVYTASSGVPYTEVGNITIQRTVDTFGTGPGPGQDYQPDTIVESDRMVFEDMADEYYSGTNTSGVVWRII